MPTNRLKELREKANLSPQKLAERIGTTRQQIFKLEKGERRLTLEWLQRLAAGLGVEPSNLLPEPTEDEIARRSEDKIIPPDKPQSLAKSPDSKRIDTPRLVEDSSDLIPIRSAARGGSGQVMFLSDGPLDWTRRPSVLRNVVDAYAIYMAGDSMRPMFRPSYILWVNPHLPVAWEEPIAITMTNDEVIVKIFERLDKNTLFVKQLNPPLEIEVPRSEIREIHVIVGYHRT